MRIEKMTWITAVSAAFFILLGAKVASAAECASDAGCGEGTVCEVVGGADCAEPACPPGEPCPAPAPCEPVEISECVPAPCASDADCADGLVCLTNTWQECSGGAAYECPPDSSCPPTPTECTTQSESRCMPQWIAPCETAVDCGAGFQCVASEECICSGSGGSAGGTVDGGAAPDPDCTCWPSGEKHCEPELVACNSDADCRSGWTCDANPDEGVCSYDPTTGQTDCGDPASPDLVCLPPFWEVAAAGAGQGEFAKASDSSSSSNASTRSGGSCSVSAPASSCAAPAWLALGLALGGLALRRRREAATS